jgi:hypothetical protein
MKLKKGCLFLVFVVFILTFRVGIISEYNVDVRTSPHLTTDFDVTYNVDRYPFLLFVNDPYTFYVFVKTDEETINAKINHVEIVLNDETKGMYKYETNSKIVQIDKKGLNLVLRNVFLPSENVELNISINIINSQGEADYLIGCKLNYERKIEFGNYFYDRLMAI